ncbi:MAG: UvrD-helicase domain-containing protein [Defluviitaleaceae bacterium]|nr:UvrD-helicase domain-containing protein [Defluviitaleaceae bacterium]
MNSSENLLAGLNPPQREAAEHIDGALLLFAGAGSGKTRTLTYRIAHMILQGISPFNILAITFTNKAAREMRERVHEIAEGGQNVWVSTFHSLCVRILRREIERLEMDSRFTIYDTDDSERLIKDCIKELNVNDKQYPARSMAAAISGFKNELLTPYDVRRDSAGDFRRQVICDIYTLYQKKLRLNNALDFDDLIFETVNLFRRHEDDVLARYQERFQYILVDEYQDTNTAQYMLVRLLAERHGNLCVVGDDDQSIYGWRGADIRNILEFEKDYPDARVIKLEQNYRSTQTILDAANAVIGNNIGRKQKRLWTENGRGHSIVYHKARTDIEEGQFVAETILSAHRRGAALKNFAVLYRTNAQSRVVEDTFVRRGIPYRLLGGVRFYERREIKDILAYLKFLNNPNDTVALMRIINVPRRGIGAVTIEKVMAHAEATEISFFAALNELEHISGLGKRAEKLEAFRDLMQKLIDTALSETAFEVVKQVIASTGYVAELEQDDAEETLDRINNIEEFLSKAAGFDGSLPEFLDEVALVADVDGYNENDDTVVLMTLHSSKGLEFKNVFIIGFEEGLFPSYMSITSGDRDKMEEERRLCYVGITRAKESLVLTGAVARMYHGETVCNSSSRFLREIPKEYRI